MLNPQTLRDWCDKPRRAGWLLFALLVVSFVGKVTLRLVVLRDEHYWQSGYSLYFRMAETYLRTGTFCLGDPNTAGAYYAFRPPLYPLFIAAVCRITQYSADAFVVCEALISTLTVALVYGITVRLARAPAALLSTLCYAFYPYSFVHDTQLQENVLYNALSLAAAGCFVIALDGKKGCAFFLAGIVSGAAVLTRTSHLAATLFLGGSLLLVFRHQPRQACRSLLAFALGLLVLLGPWLIRNQLVAGHFAVTSETGFALARAHNDYTFQYYPYRASIDESWGAFHKNMDAEKRRELEAVRDDEFACGDWYSRQALDYIVAHPLETLWHGFYKVAVNFLGILSPLQEPHKNWVYTICYWLLTVPAVYGLWKVRGTSFFKVFLAMVLAQVAVSFVFWAHTSHRSFLDPLFAISAGIGLCALVSSRSDWCVKEPQRGGQSAEEQAEHTISRPTQV
jgi:4-amino-4-deoxy-L-arabinose transferase-like glycosyltransferase